VRPRAAYPACPQAPPEPPPEHGIRAWWRRSRFATPVLSGVEGGAVEVSLLLAERVGDRLRDAHPAVHDAVLPGNQLGRARAHEVIVRLDEVGLLAGAEWDNTPDRE